MEYCVSEGWIRVAAGRSRDRFGQPMTIKLKGKVEPYFEHPAQDDGRSFRGVGRAPARAPVAPLPERPAAERQRSERGHAAPRERRRAVADDCALGALVPAGDLLAQPRARKLAQASLKLLRN